MRAQFSCPRLQYGSAKDQEVYLEGPTPKQEQMPRRGKRRGQIQTLPGQK